MEGLENQYGPVGNCCRKALVGSEVRDKFIGLRVLPVTFSRRVGSWRLPARSRHDSIELDVETRGVEIDE